MMLNIFHIYSVDNKELEFDIKKSSRIYASLNYIDFLCESSSESLNKKIKSIIEKSSIDYLFITMSNMDCSLDLIFLNNLKRIYNLKIVFLFESSEYSFEYIDRYYAQIAQFVIIYNTPYIKDFYEMLEIECYILNKSIMEKEPYIKNVFCSSLVALNKNNKSTKNETKTIQEILKLLDKKSVTISNDLLIDKKYLNVKTIYDIYWIIRRYKSKKNLKVFTKLFRFKYLKYFFMILKMLEEKNINKISAFELINKILYKEYKL